MPIRRPTIVVAYDENRGIGIESQMPWEGKLPADLKHFRELTKGQIVVMGRKTLDSIGRPLPGRENRIVTRDESLAVPGASVYCNNHIGPLKVEDGDDRKIYIIGGEEIYRKYIPAAEYIIATEVDADYSCDTFFPELKSNRWEVRGCKHRKADSINTHGFVIAEYARVCGDYIDTTKARSPEQELQFSQIELDGVCPFCTEYITEYHDRPVEDINDSWLFTENMIPYDGAEKHSLFIPKRHVEHPSELTPNEWSDFGDVVKKFGVDVQYGGIAMRFGPISHTGASVAHLHIHMIKPEDGSDEAKKVKFKISR
jgi:dihydrofolate reductase